MDPGRDVDPKVPQAWNLYAYVRNNPVNATDPDGKLTLVFTVGRGRDLFEKAGHSALFVASATGDSAGISLGGEVKDFSEGVGAFVKAYNAKGRTVSVSVLNTSPGQDAKMINFLRSNPDGAVNFEAFGASAMVRENCAQAVGNTLEAGGVFSPGSNPSQVLGEALSLPSQLAQEVEGLDIYLGTIVLILGQRTRRLLDLFGIPWRESRAGCEREDALWVVGTARETRLPAALLVAKGADS